MDCYVCIMCGYIYDPEIGDPTQGVDPKTTFEMLSDEWVCPMCYAEKSEFEIME